MQAEELEEIIGVRFEDKNLLRTALTHSSYLNEAPTHVSIEDNERLEYLGDALLDFVVGEMLYRRFPDFKEGMLTDVRAALVRESTLADFARRIRLGEALYMGHGEVASGGRDRDTILCAAFEALVGAIYLDQGLEAVKEFVVPMVESALPEAVEMAALKDPKTRLQEITQARGMGTPSYEQVEEKGPEHRRTFVMAVYVGGEKLGEGEGRSKQAASREAAMAALARLERGEG